MTAKNLPVTSLPVEMGAAPGQSWLVSRDTVDMTRQARPLRPLIDRGRAAEHRHRRQQDAHC